MTNSSQRQTNVEQNDSIGFAENEANENSKYLVFRLGTELYGTPLLGVREVLEPLNPKPIPNTVEHFKGLINVRGQIMGVVDLRGRFGYPRESPVTLAYLIFETDAGPIAAIVDKVEAVYRFEDAQAQKKPHIRSQVPMDFLLGASTYQNQLVTLIDLNKTLSGEDYVEIKRAKMANG